MPYEEEQGLHIYGKTRCVKQLEPQAVGGKTEILRKPVMLIAVEGGHTTSRLPR